MWLFSRILFFLTALSLLAGCRQSTPPSAPAASAPSASPASAAPTAPTPLTPEQLALMRPNEAGVIPILEYHDISNGHNTMCRSAEKFRADLERLYTEGYRPIALRDLLANRIATPPGKSPVVFTFDDARKSQFRYLPDGTIDPDCAVGILQAFAKKHPDFPVSATFYVLPKSGFGPPSEEAAKKMQALLDMGCEIGNHTVTHPRLNKLSDQEVQREIGECVSLVKQLVPKAEVETIALPLGLSPRNRALLASGAYQGQQYANKAVLLVGANPAPSPISSRYDPMRLPRVQACEGAMGITYWLDSLKQHPDRRYVSDGDPNTITVPRTEGEKVDKTKLNGATLRLY